MRATPDGQITRVRDVGRVELGANLYALRSLLDNKPAVAIGIFQRPGHQRHRSVEPGARRRWSTLKQAFPEGVDYQIVYDPTVFVRNSITAVVETLFEAILLVVIVVMVFLQTWRASIIPLVAVPVSLIGTFAVMLAMGFSLNTLSLFGLVLSIGIVVDDAIVVVENVERHIELGLPPLEATQTGDGRSLGPDHRDRARALRGVRADGVRQRPDRAVLSPVRADDRDLDGHLGVQLADAQPGAGVAAAQAARGVARHRAARGRSAVRVVLPRRSTGFFTRASGAYTQGVGRVLRVAAVAIVLYRRPDRPHGRRVLARAAGIRADAGQGVSRRVRAAA